MASRGTTALTSDATLTVTAQPAPVDYRQTLPQDLHEIWQWLIGKPVQIVVTGGVIGYHQANGDARLAVGHDSVAGEAHHALGQSSLTITETPTVVGFGHYYSHAPMTIDVPVSEFNAPVELTFFNVVGNWYNVAAPPLTGSSTQATLQVVSGFVTFWPGYIDANGAAKAFPKGFSTFVENLDLGDGVGYSTSIALAPIQVRILSGQLETIDTDNAAGIQLVANSDVLNLAAQGYGQLIYNVQFTNVVYAGNAQVLSNFAFVAPTDETELSITDPGLARLPYGGP